MWWICLKKDVCLYRPNGWWEGEFESPLQVTQLDNCRERLSFGVRKLFFKLSNCPYTCCSVGFQEKWSLLIPNETPANSVIRNDWNIKWDWLQWSDHETKKCSKHSRWVWCTQGQKSTSCVQLNKLLYFCCCGPIFLLEVLDILFRHMASWILSNTNRWKKWLWLIL